VSDGIRTRDRRDHNPGRAVLDSCVPACGRGMGVMELLSVSLKLDPA
jgi:hypothetical protein